MFKTLIESRPTRPRRAGSTMMSMVVHGAVIAGAVAFTIPKPSAWKPDRPVPPIVFTTVHPTPPSSPVHPIAHSPSAPAAPSAPPLIAPIAVSRMLPPIDLSGPAMPVDNIAFGSGIAPSAGPASSTGVGGSDLGGVMDAAYVERVPRVLGDAPTPRYPSALRSSGMSGRVLVRFVVDTSGRAEMAGVEIIEASHALFADAVRDVLARYRFAPGEVGGRKVRTMVQLPFVFALR